MQREDKMYFIGPQGVSIDLYHSIHYSTMIILVGFNIICIQHGDYR